MSPNVNDEHPIPPEFDRNRPRDGRVRRCVIFGLCLLIPIGLLIAGIRLYLNISADARIDPSRDRYDILLARFNALDSAHSELAARFVKLNAAYIENQVRNISDHVTPRPNQKRLVEVPLSLMVTPEQAYDQMMNGDIMHDEFVAFAQTQIGIANDKIVQQFIRCNPNALIFNLHLLNRNLKRRFDKIWSFVDKGWMESVPWDRPCRYKWINGYRVWDNVTALGEYSSIYSFDKWYDPRTSPGINCNMGQIAIMEIC